MAPLFCSRCKRAAGQSARGDASARPPCPQIRNRQAPSPCNGRVSSYSARTSSGRRFAWADSCPARAITMTVLTAALVAVHLADPDRGGRVHPAGWLFIPFLAYAGANLAWVTPVRWLGWFDWLNWAQALACLLDRPERRGVPRLQAVHLRLSRRARGLCGSPGMLPALCEAGLADAGARPGRPVHWPLDGSLRDPQ